MPNLRNLQADTDGSANESEGGECFSQCNRGRLGDGYLLGRILNILPYSESNRVTRAERDFRQGLREKLLHPFTKGAGVCYLLRRFGAAKGATTP